MTGMWSVNCGPSHRQFLHARVGNAEVNLRRSVFCFGPTHPRPQAAVFSARWTDTPRRIGVETFSASGLSTEERKPRMPVRGGPQHRSTYSNGLGADVLPAAPAFGSKRFSTGNPVEGVSNGLATRVSMPCRVRSPLRWTRDPEASVSNRRLTLTLVTLSSYAGSLPIRNGRRFRHQYDHFLPTSPLKKISPFYLLWP